jgi:hypothetical protein
MRVLKEFAFGNVNPAEGPSKRSSEYDEALGKVTAIQDELISKLGKDEVALLEEFVKAQGVLDCLEYANKFATGFSLGQIMAVESYLYVEKLLHDEDDD